MDLTLGVALFAGLISFLSPCVLPVVPAYLGQLGAVVARSGEAAVVAASLAVGGVLTPATSAGTGAPATTAAPPRMSWAAAHGLAALPNAIAFVLGFGTVFTVLGLTLNAAMAPLREYLPLLRQLGGVLLIILGLNLMGVLRVRGWQAAGARSTGWCPSGRGPRRGITGGLVLGAVFALGWTPCIGPTLGAILTIAAVGSSSQAAALLIAYSLGLGIPFLLLAVAADRSPAVTRPLLRHGHTIEVVGGALVVVMGLAILFDWLAVFSNAFVAFWPQV